LPTLPTKTANAGTIAALVLAPISLVLLSFGLLFGYTAFDDMARYQNYNRTDSEELTDLKSRPKTDGRANSRIQQLESDLQRRTEIWFPQYRKRLLLNAILAFVGFLTLAASAALAYFFRPGPRLRAES
jgi:hypothetical protein